MTGSELYGIYFYSISNSLYFGKNDDSDQPIYIKAHYKIYRWWCVHYVMNLTIKQHELIRSVKVNKLNSSEV